MGAIKQGNVPVDLVRDGFIVKHGSGATARRHEISPVLISHRAQCDDAGY
jgi:hypothetical protein